MECYVFTFVCYVHNISETSNGLLTYLVNYNFMNDILIKLGVFSSNSFVGLFLKKNISQVHPYSTTSHPWQNAFIALFDIPCLELPPPQN
jgi:hypothetical protein